MRPILTAALVGFGLACAPMVHAQTSEAARVAQDYIEHGGGLILSDVYSYDSDLEERLGIEVPVPFRLQVPRFNGVTTRDFVLPDGGAFAAFQFTYAPEGTEENGAFLENLQVTVATIPFVDDADDPEEARAAMTAQLLREQVYPNAIGTFPEGELLVLERLPLGGLENAVQMIGSHIRPESGARELVRAVIFPHPEQAASLMVVSRINLALVPAVDGETLAASITGRMLTDWEYLPLDN